MISRCLLAISFTALTACMGNQAPAPDDGNPMGSDPKGNDPKVEKTCNTIEPRIWRLSPEQIDLTIQSLLPGAPSIAGTLKETLAKGELANAASRRDISQPHVESMLSATDRVAFYASANSTLVNSCANSTDTKLSNNCLDSILDDFVARAFRRPLNTEQKQAYKDFYNQEASASTAKIALEALVQTVLVSPEFQYRQELPVDGSIDSWAIAENIAYTISDSPPDAQLRQAAASGSLTDEKVIAAHAARLLTSLDSAQGILRLFENWLTLDLLEIVDLDDAVHEDWDPSILDDFAEETRRFLTELFENDGTFEELWTADWTIVNPRLADWYGLSHPGQGWQRVSLTNTTRRGILGQGSFLVQNNDGDYTSIITRGFHLLKEYMCWSPAVPENVPPFAAEPEGRVSQRERLDSVIAASGAGCTACHKFFNPLGYALEGFDAAAKERKKDDNDIDVDLVSEWILGWDPGATKQITGLADVASTFANEEQAKGCFTDHITEYLSGKAEFEQTECAADAAREAMLKPGATLAEVITSLVTHSQFIERGGK